MPLSPRIVSRLLCLGIVGALLPLAAGCGHDSLSTRGSPGPAEIVGGTAAIPPIASLALSRERDGGTLTIRLADDPGIPTLPLAPVPTSGRSWTLQVAFDLDRDPRTGDRSGAELAVALVSPDRAAWLAHDHGAWRRVAESGVVREGGTIGIAVPEGMLAPGADPVVAVEGYVVTPAGTGQLDVAPAYCASFPHPDGSSPLIPAVVWMRAVVRGESLVLNVLLRPRHPDTHYDPGTPGGWMLQMLLNTDLAPTGYRDGYDFVVRGGEWIDGEFVVRRIEPGDQWPGGWGPESGRARFDLRHRSFRLAVPRSALGGDDGNARFLLEFFQTDVCPDCPSGITHSYFEQWYGETEQRGRRGGLRVIDELERGAPRYGITAPPTTTGSHPR